DDFQQGPPAGHGPPGGTGTPGMPGGTGGAAAEEDDKKVTYYQPPVRTNENLTVISYVPKDDVGTILKLIGRVMTASGVTAIDEGLFQGTLTHLNKGIRGWEDSAPGELKGLKLYNP